MINTGFSWMRVDKGNIQCNFRYLDENQVKTVLKYMQSFYEYRNIEFGIIDLEGCGVQPIEEAGEHYRPSGADPNLNYYFFVQLHRHGMIIPQGCIETLIRGVNAIASKEFVPEYVFIQRLKDSKLTVDDELTLTAITALGDGSQAEWATSDDTVIEIPDDQTGLSCPISAIAPGDADISVTITANVNEAISVVRFPTPSALWVGHVFKYTGTTVTMKQDGGKLYPADHDGGISITFTTDAYYECVYDASLPTKYKWQASDYSGDPQEMSFTDIYTLHVKSYVRITTKDQQKMCLYWPLQLSAYSPSGMAGIEWSTSTGAVEITEPATGETCDLTAIQVGSTEITARLIDAFGTYTDTLPLTVFAVDAHPDSVKMVAGQTSLAYIPKADIFKLGPEADPVPVDWVSSSSIVATVEEREAGDMSDATHNHSEADITAQGVGQAFISAVVTDPTDGMSYSDSIKVTVGNVAIQNTDNNTIYLLSGTKYLDLTAVLTPGFTINNDGWTTSNDEVVAITTVSGTDNVNCRVSSVADTVGSAIITVHASNGGANDSDTILVKVVDAEYVTSSEMKHFTNGMFNGRGVVDWDPEHPTEMEVDDSAVLLATQEEVDEALDGVFEEEMPNPVAGYVEGIYRYLGETVTMKQDKGVLYPEDHEGGIETTFTTDTLYECVVDTSCSSQSHTYYKWQEYVSE